MSSAASPTASRPSSRATRDASDEELLAEFRSGHDAAFAELYARHHRTAASVARRVVGPGPAADDVVAESFTALLAAVRRGGGPSGNVRSYLLTTVRNTAVGFLRSQQKAVPAEAEVIDRPHEDGDGLVAADDDHRVRRAFAELSPRWRRVLWYVDVHDLPPSQVAPLLGVSPNAVSSLARRARERLRRAYLQAHQDRVAPGCEDYAPHLARYVDETLALPVHRRVGTHVLACVHCAAAVDQMRDLRRRMRGLLLPLGLPVAAAGELPEEHGAEGLPDGWAAVRGGHRGVRALGRRWWWARPRVGRREIVLVTACVALCALTLSAVAASGVVGGSVPDVPGLTVAGSAAGDDEPERGPVPAGDSRPPGSGGRDDADPSTGGAGASPGRRDAAGDGRDRVDGTGRTDDRPVRWEVPGAGPGDGGGPSLVDLTPPAPGPVLGGRPPSSLPPDPAPPSEPGPRPTASPVPEPDPLTLVIEHDDLGDLVPGRTGVLGATVSNPNADPSGRVVVEVVLPDGVTLDTAGRARAVTAWSCDQGPSARVVCTVGTIAAGATSTVLVPVLVAADLAVGDVVLRLDLHGEGVARTSVSEPVPVRAGSLAARYVATGAVEITQVGAPVLHCAPAAPGCAAAAAGTATGPTQNNNAWAMVAVDALGTGSTSSAAVLDVPVGAEVLAARLYWSGGCAGTIPPARVAPPGGTLTTVENVTVDRSGSQVYQASADVTELVRAGGAGTWGVADVCATEAVGGYAGWALVVVHRPAGSGPAGPGLAIVYDGLLPVSSTAGEGHFSVAGRPGTTARVGAVVWDGDRSVPGDQLLFDGAPLVPLRWTGAGPGGPGSGDNAFDSTAWGSAYANALGVDVKPFEPAFLTSTRAQLTAVETNGDAFVVGVVTVTTGS
ncbi:sigma-70 family RNA polymerase sigma factor [Promicromonospora sp. NPDC050880]|uniref:sigma-70 family RNA polymerase sigma factor n=1 Tax=Promicromonospora sp. NPDC050880 TaxID=3364406 RepID=UPI003799F087